MGKITEDFILPFGKHKGKSIKELFIDDISYLDWLAMGDILKPRMPRELRKKIFKAHFDQSRISYQGEGGDMMSRSNIGWGWC
jgi:hypothetical protein